jgi:hypothetical protein
MVVTSVFFNGEFSQSGDKKGGGGGFQQRDFGDLFFLNSPYLDQKKLRSRQI